MNVLLVDDEPNILRLLEPYLTKHGYTVDTASDGLEALAKIRIQIPDVLITDVMMPEMDGFELLTTLRTDSQYEEYQAAIKIIVMAARPNDIPLDQHWGGYGENESGSAYWFVSKLTRNTKRLKFDIQTIIQMVDEAIRSDNNDV